jgi:hypothetical protein
MLVMLVQAMERRLSRCKVATIVEEREIAI